MNLDPSHTKKDIAQAIEVIDKASVILIRNRWIKNQLITDSRGRFISLENVINDNRVNDCKMCLTGALCIAANDVKGWEKAFVPNAVIDVAYCAMGESSISMWNDNSKRTYEDIPIILNKMKELLTNELATFK